ncbi:hypothetical protein [Mycetocola zhadangensis]|uniref:WXG100 family type VII secretion target n=1 Tax=Mycetocola zhadangensis TaxID=1164595 RepID=A0A3L7J465_9MICO|nr:hypothetical protein [Mycetocola zhadangensis]RLQ85367.1 hypothetical protein D9V28_00265 [Mycetocola zhadangensis]GGE81988.1 hypothetical protein GCM10011313_00520 [Mycetocola zhadangensis]
MSGQLIVKGQLLKQTQIDLQSILTEFEGAEKFSEAVADLTGHPRLAGRVRDFASSWNIKRDETIESVKAIKDSVGSIADTFTQLDADLAKALTKTSGTPIPGVPSAS